MVFGIGLRTRIPRELLGEHDLALLERGYLKVARAKVEADAVAVDVVLDDHLALVRHGHLLVREYHHLERTPVDVVEKAVVERAAALLRIIFRDGLDDFVRTCEIKLPAACRPKDKLHDTFCQMADARQACGIDATRNRKVVTVHVTVLTLPCDRHKRGLVARMGAQKIDRLGGRLKSGILANAAVALLGHDVYLLYVLNGTS